MVSKEGDKCVLTSSESEVEPAVSLALEMKYALDPNRQVKKRNKALQVRFKDICEAQNEQRDKLLSTVPQTEKKDAKSLSYKAYRKYMTVPARRSIPNVTKSTGVQTSPDLKKRYQTFPLDRKKGNILKSAAGVDTLKNHNNGFLIDMKDKKDHSNSGEAIQCSRVNDQVVAELTIHSSENMDIVHQHHSSNCSDLRKSTDLHSCTKESPFLENPANTTSEQVICHLHEISKHEKGPLGNVHIHQPAHVKVLLKEEATIHSPTLNPNLTDPDENLENDIERTVCPVTEDNHKRIAHLNGIQSQDVNTKSCATQSHCQSMECNEQNLQINVLPMEKNKPCQTTDALSDECQQIVPHTEVIDLKAQLQTMENLISSSQETIKVLLGVIQELEKGEAHREGLSYRTGQDTSNCDTCRNSACIIYSVELDFKQQEDKLQPVLKKLHPIEETQVAPLPYPAESSTSTPKQKSKTESKKHGRWKLWFL
ncbi:inhibitory synaptic factor 2A [Bombina bombina]|uniref:inhibitory synaptic factor 2A n=1 Tax=Bombina bombina TaxID=8345 RepID=UPI00235A9166|nr:inhibitory synaptic factor 2A [Bombina bombina]